MSPFVLVGAALAGTLCSGLLSCLPAMHIYNVAGLVMALFLRGEGFVSEELLAMFLLGLVVGYAVVNSIPGIFFGAPDDSTLFVVPPGQRLLLQRRGFEASVLSGVGALGGLAALLMIAPFAPRIFSVVRMVVAPHLHWILGAVIAFMLLSEWPKGYDRGHGGLARFLDAWRSLGAGLVTFFLSGLLGFILFYGNLVPMEAAFQNLMPAFMGLFAIPWILLNLVSQAQVPPQHLANSMNLSPVLIARGVGAGALGGLFAAFFPGVTGGIGGLLAGHATAGRDDRVFIISQGASKLVYYVGGFLLLFMPGLHLTRGGMAWMLSIAYTPRSPTTYWVAVAATLLCGALAFLLLLWLTRGAIWLVSRYDYRLLSALTLVLVLVTVQVSTGGAGLVIAAVATGIGLLPALWGARRMNCMGVLLLPLTLNMAGVGSTVAGWLGLG